MHARSVGEIPSTEKLLGDLCSPRRDRCVDQVHGLLGVETCDETTPLGSLLAHDECAA